MLAGLFEQRANLARTQRHEGALEVSALGGDEIDARLLSQRLGKERLAVAGRPLENDALDRPHAQASRSTGVLEHAHNLAHLALEAVHAGDVVERHARLAHDLERVAAVACQLVYRNSKGAENEGVEQEVDECVHHIAGVGRACDLRTTHKQALLEVGRVGVVRAVQRVRLVILQREKHAVLGNLRLVDLLLRHLCGKFLIRHGSRRGLPQRPNQRRDRHDQARSGNKRAFVQVQAPLCLLCLRRAGSRHRQMSFPRSRHLTVTGMPRRIHTPTHDTPTIFCFFLMWQTRFETRAPVASILSHNHTARASPHTKEGPP